MSALRCALIGALVCGLLPRQVHAALATQVRIHTDAVRAAVEYPLPAVAEILGPTSSVQPVPLVVIADFNEGKDDCRLRALGEAVGVTLRVTAWGLSRQLAFTHPTGYWTDGWAESGPHRVGRAGRVSARSGARWTVMGDVTESATGFEVRFLLRDALSGAASSQLVRTSDAQGLAGALATGLAEALGLLGATVEPAEQERLDRLATANEGLLRFAVAQRNQCEGGDYAAEIERAWNDAPGFPPLAALYAQDAATRHSAQVVAAANFDSVLAQAGWHPVVRMVASYAELYNSPYSRNDAATTRLTEIAQRYSHEPVAILALSDALAAEELIFEYPGNYADPVRSRSGPIPHPPSYAAAIAAVLRAAELWPDYYRSWWCVAYVLGQYSAAIRGGDYWQNVPESARRRIPLIGAEIDYALSRAIELHPVQAKLHILQIESDTDAGRDWVPTFRKAVALMPDSPGIYRVGFNYSQDQWGGSMQQRLMVYRTAVANNPLASWPGALYRAHAPWWESYPITYWRQLLGVIVALLGGLVLERRLRRTTRHSETD